MPMGGDFAFTAAYLTGGEAAARLLNFALMVVLAAWSIGRRCAGFRIRAALMAALFASTPWRSWSADRCSSKMCGR